MATPPISILIVDDHALVRGTLVQYIRGAGDMTLAGEAASAGEALEAALRLEPDIVIMDIEMPGLLSFDVARKIRAKLPGTRVIFLSAFHHDRYIEQALSAEAAGYLTKNDTPESILEAIREVRGGGMHFSPDVLSRIVVDSGRALLASGPRTRTSTLTPREMEVLRYLARGKSKKEIAGLLHLSLNTINRHTAGVMAKLGIHDRVELARFAIREGIVEA